MTPALTPPAEGVGADPDRGLSRRLMAGVAHRLAARPAPGLVLFGFVPAEVAQVEALLAGPGAGGVGAAFADPAALAGFRPSPGAVLMVNLDAFAGLAEAVAALIAFRARWPAVGVVLASAATGGDDFGADRRAIGDVTLRLPLSARRLERALDAIRDR